MIEFMMSLVAMTFMFIIIVRMSSVKLNDQGKVAQQYAVLAVDAYFANIYADWQECLSCDIQQSESGSLLMSFSMPNDIISTYNFNTADNGCYDDGVWQFEAVTMKATKVANNLFISIKLPDGNIFDLDIYR